MVQPCEITDVDLASISMAKRTILGELAKTGCVLRVVQNFQFLRISREPAQAEALDI